MENFNPGLRNLVNLGKSYEKSVAGEHFFYYVNKHLHQSLEKKTMLVTCFHLWADLLPSHLSTPLSGKQRRFLNFISYSQGSLNFLPVLLDRFCLNRPDWVFLGGGGSMYTRPTCSTFLENIYGGYIFPKLSWQTLMIILSFSQQWPWRESCILMQCLRLGRVLQCLLSPEN